MNERSMGYGVAVLAVLVATALRLGLDTSLSDRLPFTAFFLAVLVTAWFGGVGPTILATVLGALSASWFFLAPQSSLVPDTLETGVALAVFIGFGLGLAALSGKLRSRSRDLLRQRGQFEVTLASIGDGVIVTDVEARVTFLNDVAERLTGWALSDARGRPLDEVFPIRNEVTGEPVRSPVARVLAEGAIVGLGNHTILTSRDGGERAIDDSAAPIRHPDGEIDGVVLVFRDVSEKRQHELVRQRLAAVVESSEDAVLGQTLDGTVTAWNRGAERLFGYSAEETVGRPIFETIAPEERRGELLAALERVGRGERVEHFVTVRRTKQGRELPVSIRISPIRGENGEIVGASAIDRDITQQVQAERRRAVRLAVTQTLAESDDLQSAAPRILRAVCEALGWEVGVFWRLDPDAGVLRCAAYWQDPRHDERAPARGGFRDAARETTFSPGASLPGRVWSGGRPQWLADVTADPDFLRAPQAAEEGLHGGFALPLGAGEGFRGVLEFYSRDIEPPDDDLLELAGTVGGQIAQFIDRRRTEAELRRSEEELSDFFSNATMGLHWVGPDGTILRANRCELEMLGYEEDEYVGHHIAEFHADGEVIENILARLKGRETLDGHPARLRCKDGTIRHVVINSNVLWDDEGNFVHTRCFTRDVSEEMRLRAELERSVEELREADRRKDEFLAMLSHELRNPLAPIRHGLEILSLRHGQDKVIDSMQSQIVHLVRLVDDLLDVSRIMRGRVELRREPVDLAELVRQATAAVQPVVDQRGQQLLVSLPGRPVTLDADPVRLAQVIENLVGNASKYSEPGGRIEVEVRAGDEDVALTVRDTGIGIEEDLLPHVFDLFTQSPRSLERAQGGLGIGLTLVRQLVTLHGGTVSASSAGPGEGSSFTVRLPLVHAEAPAEPPAGAPRPARDRRILVVDDNVEAAQMLAALLETLGEHRVTVAHDGTSALREVSESRPEIVLLDIGLPGLDGYEVGSRMRGDPRFDGTLLVAVTGYGQEEDRRRSREAGFDEHLVKPVSVAELEDVLAHPKLERQSRDAS
jgi:PAS domain S-box-containing protein